MKISVIIPAIDEEAWVAGAVASAACGAVEVLVVDGGSADRTVEVAVRAGARVIRARRGRGAQMDMGAEEAVGDVLLFLHADSRLPSGWPEAVGRALEGAGAVGGAFTLAIDAEGAAYRLVERWAAMRSRLMGLPYGDQAIFARACAFRAVGGFLKLPLMEEVDCVKRLRLIGDVSIIRERVLTSQRRWAKRGVLGASAQNLLFLALYFLGASPGWIYRLYYGRSPAP